MLRNAFKHKNASKTKTTCYKTQQNFMNPFQQNLAKFKNIIKLDLGLNVSQNMRAATFQNTNDIL